MNKGLEFKNFEEFFATDEDKDLEKSIKEAFSSLDEGLISNISNLGFFKGLKLSFAKGMSALVDIIKKNPDVQKDLHELFGKVGTDTAKEIGEIFGKMAKKLQDKNDELQRRLDGVKKTPYFND